MSEGIETMYMYEFDEVGKSLKKFYVIEYRSLKAVGVGKS